MKIPLLRNIIPVVFLGSLLCAPWAQAQAADETLPADVPAVAAAVPIAASPPVKIWLTFGLDRVPWLQSKLIADIPLWQYLASLLYILLAFYVSKALDFFIRNRVQKWAGRTATKVDDLLVALVRGPVNVVAFVILLHIGMTVYSWPETLASFFSAALKIIVACSITYVLIKAVDALLGLWRERSTTPENEQFSRQLLPLIGKSLKVFVVIVAALVTSQNLGLNVTGLIASLSIGGLAVGLSAQDTLANLFGAMAVLMDKPFKGILATNPLTAGVFYPFAFVVGCRAMGHSVSDDQLGSTPAWHAGGPLLLGCALLEILAGLSGWLLIRRLWRGGVVPQSRASQLIEKSASGD